MNISDDDLFSAMREMRQKHPNWRFGQMIANLATWARGAQKDQVWDVEDSELVEAARRHLQHKSQKDGD
jgi:hypothetical protein